MATGAVFPAFIRATYQETSEGLPAFERAMATSINRTRKAADVSMEDIKRQIGAALAGGDSDFGLSNLRAAAAAADARAKAARTVASALATTAAAEADYSLATQASIAAARRLADEEENAARSALLHVTAVERMAEAARRSNIDITALAGSNNVAVRSANAHRQAQMMLGQQMQDAAIQMQLGINPLMILTQQGTQAAYSLTQMGGRAAAVGRYLSNPWTAALMIAGTALVGLMGEAEDTADALEKVKFSSDGVGDAQSILGAVMNTTTGAITTQRQELIGLALAQAKVAAIQAQARAATLRSEVEGLQSPTTVWSGGLGGGFNVQRKPAGAVGAISRSVLAGEMDTRTAVQRLDNLRKAGALTDEAFANAAKSIASLGVELANSDTFKAAERLINQVGGSSDRRLLLKPGKDRPERKVANDNGDTQKAAEERAAKELETATRAVINRYDQAKASSLQYADALAEIARLQKAGKLTPDDARRYAEAAAVEKAEQDRQMFRTSMDKLFKDIEPEIMSDQAKADIDAAQVGLKSAAEASQEMAANISNGLTAIADFFGSDVANFLNDISANLGKDSQLNQLVAGIGEGRQRIYDGIGDAFENAMKEVGLTGSDIGGAIGAFGAAIQINKQVGNILGFKGGPFGIFQSAFESIINPSRSAGATLTGVNSYTLGGKDKGQYGVADDLGSSVSTGLENIASALGASLGGFNTTIGIRDGDYRVNTSGTSLKLKNGAKDFGDDAEAAIKYAIADAIKDGALLGLRASTQALLTKTDDVEAQLQKALDFESVFATLKSYKDPVGAALDTLDQEFSRLTKIFDEAGASTAEYAQLEELYGIKRTEAVKEAGEKITASLKALFDDLTVGNDARSLRDRLAEAQASYSPLAARVAAGDTAAYDDYADAARQLLDLQRQISGSSTDYFALLDEVTGLTKSRIDAETNIASISAGRDSIFAAESLAPVVSATEAQTAALVSVMKSELGAQTSELKAMSSNFVTLARIMTKGGAATSGAALRAGGSNF